MKAYSRLALPTIVLSMLLLAGCANDQYTMADGSAVADTDKYHSDLKECKWEVLGNHSPHLLMLGGALGGAIDGATSSDAPKTDVYIEVQNCMADKGYNGTSSW